MQTTTTLNYNGKAIKVKVNGRSPVYETSGIILSLCTGSKLPEGLWDVDLDALPRYIGRKKVQELLEHLGNNSLVAIRFAQWFDGEASRDVMDAGYDLSMAKGEAKKTDEENAIIAKAFQILLDRSLKNHPATRSLMSRNF